MREVIRVAGLLVAVSLGLFPGRGLGQDDTPFSRRGKPEEREEKLAKAIRAIAKNSELLKSAGDFFLIVYDNCTSDSPECGKLAYESLMAGRPKEFREIDIGKLVPQVAQAVAKQYPNSYFYFQFYLRISTKPDTPFEKVTEILGKEDRTEKEEITVATTDEGGEVRAVKVPITWHFYGWCGFGVAKDGHVYALKVKCKDVPVKASLVQADDEVEKLRRENELLKKENELLRMEIKLLKEAKAGGGDGAKTGEKSRTQAFVGGVEYKLVKCVRDPEERDRVIFSFAARHDGTGPDTKSTIHVCRDLILTSSDGKTLKGRIVDGPKTNVWLEDKEWSKFQVTFAGVDRDVTGFDEVGLVMGSQLGIPRPPVKFYRIRIEPK